MSEVNSENVFEREMELCQDFRFYEDTEDVRINFNVSAKEITI